MNREKLLKVVAGTLTIGGAVVAILQKMDDDKKMEALIDKKVQERLKSETNESS